MRVRRDGIVKPEEAFRYSLSLPITALISGIGSMEHLEQNSRAAIDFKPYSKAEMAALEARCVAYKQYEPYRHWVYRDGHGPSGTMAAYGGPAGQLFPGASAAGFL